MKNFILFRIAKVLIGYLDGYKTIIAGLIPFFGTTIGAIGLFFPDLQVTYDIPQMSMKEVTAGYTGAFTIWGLGGKAEKIKKAVVK